MTSLNKDSIKYLMYIISQGKNCLIYLEKLERLFGTNIIHHLLFNVIYVRK